MLSPISVLNIKIHPTSYAECCDRIEEWIASTESRFIVAANVHVVMTGVSDQRFREVLGKADRITPDGMPIVWALRLLGVSQQQRVYGPDLLLAWCARASRSGSGIYLYGSTEAVLERLVHNLQDRFPGLQIVGTYAPPFGEIDVEADLPRIRTSGASVVFIGLGCPKQEYWMAEAVGKLPMVMIGVGAAFAFHAGVVSQAPRWMMNWGLEWLYRLCQEPRRLWKRYLLYNPWFLGLFMWQLLRHWLKL